MTDKIRNAIDLRQFADQTTDKFLRYIGSSLFKEFPQLNRKAMFDCLDSLCDMRDGFDKYIEDLRKEEKEALEKESEADLMWAKTFGGL